MPTETDWDAADWVRAEAAANALGARLERFWEHGDRGPVMEPQALAEADALAPMVLRLPEAAGGVLWILDVEGVALIAALFYARALACESETPEFTMEASRCVELFAIVGRFSPESIPEDVREAAAAMQLPPIASVEALQAETEQALQEWLHGSDPAALDTAATAARIVVDVLPRGHATRVAALADLSTVLRNRHAALGSEADLDEALDTARESVRLASPADPQRAHYLACLAAALNGCEPGSPDERDEAVDAAVEAVWSATRPDDWLHQVKGFALLRRFWLVRDTADLDAAVEALQAAVALAEPGDLNATGSLIQLGLAHYERYGLNEASSDLDACIDAVGRGLSAGPLTPRQRVAALKITGLALRHRRTSTTDLEASEEALRTAAAEAAGTRDSAGLQREIGRTCLALFGLSGDLDTVDRAVEAFRHNIEEEGDTAASALALAGLGEALSARFERSGRLHDTDEAEEVLRRAIALLDGENAAGHRHCTIQLGSLIANRYERTESAADLERAVALFTSLLDGDIAGEQRSGVATRLAHLLMKQYALTEDHNALDRSIEWNRHALAACGTPGGRSRAVALAGLGRSLSIAFDHGGTAAMIVEAVEHLEEAAACGDRSYPLNMHLPFHLGSALLAKAWRLGSADDLDRAVTLIREASEAVPEDHPEAANVHSTLGGALVYRFAWSGRETDLHEAVRASGRAVEAAAGAGPIGRALTLEGLASALATRHAWGWALSDLDEAVAIRREIVALLPERHAFSARMQAELAAVLIERYARRRDLADANEAVDAARAAVKATDEDAGEPVTRISHLSRLAGALRVRGVYAERPEDTLEAVEHLREALRLSPEDLPRRGRMHAELGAALLLRVTQTRDIDDADDAVDSLRAALADADESGPDHAGFLTLYAAALLARAEIQGEANDSPDAERAQADQDDAYRLFAQAASIPGAPAIARFNATRGWARTTVERQDWEEALLAHRAALSLLPRLAWHGLDLEDRFETLGSIEGLARSAAAVALNTGRTEEALQLLEEGRGVLLAQALDARDDMTELAEREPGLAARIAGLRTALEAESLAPAPGPSLSVMPFWDKRVAAERRRALAEELDGLVTEVRALPGFEDFQRPPGIARLREAARGGPVVVVNTSSLRCDAIIVTRDGVRSLPLPKLSVEGEGGLDERAETLLTALGKVGSGGIAAWGAHLSLVQTLAWLWEAVAEPVIADLREAGDLELENGALPRLWWCPTGKLALLPLHAAGRYGPEVQEGSPPESGAAIPQDLPSAAVCSYTATVRALGIASPAPPGEALNVLVVEQSDTPGLAPLPNALTEAAMLNAVAPDATFLDGPRATRAALLQELRSREILHFAGHGGQGTATEPGGVLYCHDHEQAGPLTVADIARLRLRGARLAYLSACETAWGEAGLADESVHLAGAMQLAGFSHVVAAQWAVSDESAATAAESFYKGLLGGSESTGLNPDQSARALHAAVQRLREGGKPLLRWAAYLHMGP